MKTYPELAVDKGMMDLPLDSYYLHLHTAQSMTRHQQAVQFPFFFFPYLLVVLLVLSALVPAISSLPAEHPPPPESVQVLLAAY